MQNNNRYDLTGKVAIITGASKGIGEAIAYRMGKAGAKIVVSSRKQDAVEIVAQKFRAEGIDATAIACHVGDMLQNENLVAKTIEIYGRVDILVNNAVTNPIFGATTQADLGAFDKIMDVNVKAPFYLSKLVQPYMLKNGGGNIINISSIAGLTPDLGLGLYSVSKASLNMLTKVLAKEWGVDNIRVNSICPGVIKTKLSEALTSNEHIANELISKQALKHFGEPDDIAGIAMLLASDAGSYITGAILTADGGLTI